MEENIEEGRRVAPFFIAFFVTLVVMAGVLYWLVLFSGAGRQVAAPAGETYEAPATVYLPRKEERLVMLFAGAENKDTLPDVYLLAGFLPDKGSISVCLLPPKTLITTGDQWATVEQLFQRGGVAYAAKAVGGYLGVEIARSGYMEVPGLEKLLESTGDFEYELGTTLDYPLHQRQVAMSPGTHQLDGRAIADILAYPAYKGGELERSDRGAMLVTRMLNYHLPASMTVQGDSLVKSFLNNCKTDISYKDYEERKSATRFLATLKLPAVTAVYVEGALSRDYQTFLLTESCRARLQSVFNGDGFARTPEQDRRDARLGAYERVDEEKEQGQP